MIMLNIAQDAQDTIEEIGEEVIEGRWINIGLAAAVLLFILIIKNKMAEGILYLLLRKRRAENPEKAKEIKNILKKPLGWLLFFFAATLLLPLFALPEGAYAVFIKILYSAMILVAARLLYLAVKNLLNQIEDKTDITDHAGGKTAFGYLSGVIQVIIVVLAIVLVLNQWISNLGGVFATLGITGVALALAAQDTAANLVAGLAIMLDKPFDIGDWITTETSSGNVDGTVVSIGLRSSRVSALDGSTLTVPNSLLGSAVIVNGTKRVKRMVDERIRIKSDTPPEKMEAFRKDVLELLNKDPDILSGTAMMNFSDYERGAFVWNLRFHTDSNFDKNVAARHRINMAVSKLAREHGIEMAPAFAAKG